MVLHNDKWHKKAARNYRRKHGLKPPNRQKDHEDSEDSEEVENFESQELDSQSYQDDGTQANSDDSDDDQKQDTKSLSTTQSNPEITTGAGTLVEKLDKTLEDSGIDVSAFKGRRGKKKLGNNDWRYQDDDDLDAALARDPTLKYDPEFQEKLRLKQEEEMFEAEQLRLAREATKKKFEKEKSNYQREEEEKEKALLDSALKRKEEESSDDDFEALKRKPLMLEDLEDDSESDDDFSNTKGIFGTKRQNQKEDVTFNIYGKNSHLKKLNDDELLKYREIQQHIDRADFESSVRSRFGGKKIDTSNLSNKFKGLGLDKEKKTKALVIGEDGSAKMVIKNTDDLLVNMNRNKGIHGDNKKTNGVFDSKGTQDIDDFFDSLDNDTSGIPETDENDNHNVPDEDEYEENESEEEESDEDDFDSFKAQLVEKKKFPVGTKTINALDFLDI